MLKISNLSKSYESGIVLDGINLAVSEGEKVGLVGVNGSGKSTLLKIIAGKTRQDTGSVLIGKNDLVGYLPQHLDLNSELTVREFLTKTFEDVLRAEKELRALEKRMSEIQGEKSQKTLDKYGKLQSFFESKGGYEFESRLESILSGLGLKLDLDRKMSSLSGGQKSRVAIGQVLLMNPTILLLDEPTNHLDMPSLIWLEKYLAGLKKTVLIVSHDRRFLDRIVTRIVEIDLFSHKTVEFGGNYSSYIEEKRRLREKQFQEYYQQQKRFKRLRQDIQRTKQQAIRTEKATKDDFVRARAKKVAKKAKAREKRLEREMNAETAIAKPEERSIRKISLAGEKSKELLVNLDNVSKSFGSTKIADHVKLKVYGGDRIALIGANGAGKTTLFKMILGEISPDEGSIFLNENASIGYLPQEHHHIDHKKTAISWFREHIPMHEDEARAFLGSFAFSQEALFRPISKMSQGEVARLLVSVLVAGENNLLLLDEPTNHLDFESLDIIEEALRGYKGAFIVVTHDRYFLNRIDLDQIIILEDGQLASCPDWQTYEAQQQKKKAR